MKSLILGAALCLAAACSLPGASSGTSPSPTASPVHLDAGVPMPATFPRDVPIYPGARLIAAAGFPNSGPTSWGMEWETSDSATKVQAWYGQALNKGDWTVTFSTTTADSFAATFARKSDSRVNGTLTASTVEGVTRIEMSLLYPAS